MKNQIATTIPDLVPWLNELRKRKAYCDGIAGEDCPMVDLTEGERDALFAYIAHLERELAKAMEAHEEP